MHARKEWHVKLLNREFFTISSREDRKKRYEVTYLLTYSLTYLLTHSLTHSLIHSLTHSFTHSLSHLLTYLLTYLLTHSLTHSLTRSVLMKNQAACRGILMNVCNAIRLQSTTLSRGSFLWDYCDSHDKWREFLPILSTATELHQSFGTSLTRSPTLSRSYASLLIP